MNPWDGWRDEQRGRLLGRDGSQVITQRTVAMVLMANLPSTDHGQARNWELLTQFSHTNSRGRYCYKPILQRGNLQLREVKEPA